MTLTVSIFGLLLVLSGCCLGTTVTSGTGETAESSSTGGTDTGNGAAAGSSTGGTATSGTGTATGAGTGNGTTTGGCGSATLTVSPNLIDFGYVSPGSLAIRCTMVSNPCGASISITGVADFATGGGVFAVAATDDFPIAVGGGEHAQVCFSFTPPITQDYTGQATLLTSDGANPVVQLTGWGGGPEISCTPLTLAFGSVPIGDASTLSVTCYNTGSAAPGVLPPLLIGPLDAGGGVFSAAFDTEINPYPSGGLTPAQGAQIDVTYAPIAGTDDFGVLALPNNGGEQQTPYVSLSGRGY